MDSLKSISELRKAYEGYFEFRVKRSHKYWGASSCRDLKTIVLDSLATICSMVFQPCWPISGLLGGVKAAVGYNSTMPAKSVGTPEPISACSLLLSPLPFQTMLFNSVTISSSSVMRLGVAAMAIAHLPILFKGRGEASVIAIVMVMVVKQSICIFSLIS